MMKIVRASDTPGAFDAALDVLAAGGGVNCSLMSAFEKRLDSCFVIIAPGGAPAGAFTFDGRTLNVFLRDAGDDVIVPLKDFLKDKNVFCVMGEASSADAALKALASLRGADAPGQAFHVRHMTLMESSAEDSAPSPPALPAGFTLARCGSDDAGALFPLQCAYVKEEVLPPGRELNRASERLRLDRALKANIVLCARSPDGAVCAMAQESVSCSRFMLIGGVYTAPECRARGIARALCAALSQEARLQGKRAALYVESTNTAALRAYRAAGFESVGRYEIAYRLAD